MFDRPWSTRLSLIGDTGAAVRGARPVTAVAAPGVELAAPRLVLVDERRRTGERGGLVVVPSERPVVVLRRAVAEFGQRSTVFGVCGTTRSRIPRYKSPCWRRSMAAGSGSRISKVESSAATP